MYKKGDYIAFMSKQPAVHLNEMLGLNELDEADFDKSENVGFIQTVIDDRTYLVMTVRPMEGFRCIIDESDILHVVDKTDLTDEEREVKENEAFQAPNVYHNQTPPRGKTLEKKCLNLAKEAMKSLCPNDEIYSMRFSWSEFKKEDMLKSLRDILFYRDFTSETVDTFDRYEEMLRNLHFKEYHNVQVDVYADDRNETFLSYNLAIDLSLEEVVVMKNLSERSCFCRSLGPDYDLATKWRMKLVNESFLSKPTRKKK